MGVGAGSCQQNIPLAGRKPIVLRTRAHAGSFRYPQVYSKNLGASGIPPKALNSNTANCYSHRRIRFHHLLMIRLVAIIGRWHMNPGLGRMFKFLSVCAVLFGLPNLGVAATSIQQEAYFPHGFDATEVWRLCVRPRLLKRRYSYLF